MPAGLSVRKALVCVAAEVTPYTLEATVLAGTNTADCFPAYDITFSPDIQTFERKDSRDTYGLYPGVTGAMKGTLSCKVPLVGGGTKGAITKYHWVKAMQACGFNVTINAGTSIVLYPCSTFDGATGNPSESYSVALYEDGVGYFLHGAVGTVKIGAKLGEPYVAEFTFSGAFTSPVDVAVPTPSNISEEVPPVFIDAGFVIDTMTPIFQSVDYDLGNQIGWIMDANDTTTARGVMGAMITGRKISGSCDPLMVPVSTGSTAYDLLGACASGDVIAIQSAAALGSDDGNKIWISTPTCQITGVDLGGDADGMRVAKLKFNCIQEGGADEGDEFLITLT